MKKALKIIGVTVLVIVVFLLASPFIFQNKIKGLVKEFINENLNAKVDFKDASLSFLSSFPKANVTIDELTITNFAPFENEKLADVLIKPELENLKQTDFSKAKIRKINNKL